MTSPRVAVAAILLLAVPVFADNPPLPDQAEYEKKFEALRVKAKTAYLKPTPIGEAVTTADLKKLDPPPPYREPADRAKKNAEFIEALQAVKTLQGAPDQQPLPPGEKIRLTELVRQRLGLSSGELSAANALYQPTKMDSGPFSKAPPPSIVAATQQREAEAKARAQRVLAGGAVLREDRSAGAGMPGGYGPAAGQTGFTGQPNPRPNEPLNASDFKPRYKSGPASEVPAADGHAAPEGEHKPGLWSKVVHAANTPLPGTAGWKEKYAAFAEGRMAESRRLEQEGAALLEKGGVANTAQAGWNAVKGFGNRLVAGDKTAVMAVAVGAAAVTTAVVAAPAIAAAGVTMGALKVGVLAFTAYSTVNATAAIVKEPDYANAGGLAVNFVGAKYAGAVAHKVGHMTEKAIATIAARQTGKVVVAETAAAGTAVVAESTVAGASASKLVAQELAATGRVVAEKSAHVGVEVAHEYTKETVAHSFKAHDPAPAPPVVARSPGAGPFSASLPGGGKPH